MEELKMNLINIINESTKTLPLEAIYYIVKDVYREVEDGYIMFLKQKENRQEEEEEEN